MKRVRRGGFALVVTLALIVLIAILVTGFVVQARLETSTAKSHSDGVRAGLYAQAGVDTALARIQKVLSTGSNVWMSAPGRLLVYSGSDTANNTVVELSSGAAPANASADQAVDFNVRRFADPTRGLLADNLAPMQAGWIYVRQDGSLDTNAPPASNPSNPVIGRYAFWADDETAKINVNTAWIKAASNTNYSAANSGSYPSLIDLTALCETQANADAVRNFRTTNHFFNTPDEVAQVSAAWKTIAAQNQSAITYYNHSPDLNMFGEPKIMLTTSTNLAGGTNCIDILKTAGADPGGFANLDAAKVANVYRRLYRLMTRTDWPMMPGQSLAQKYAPMDVRSVCLNIIDYVRSAESASTLVEPLRGGGSGDVLSLDWTTGSQGNSRRVLVTELGAYVPDSKDSSNNWPIKCRLRVYLPPDSGISTLDLTSLQLLINISEQNPNSQQAQPHNVESRILAGEVISGNSLINAGEYRTIARDYTVPAMSGTASLARPKILTFQIALANPANPGAPKRYDVAVYNSYQTDIAGTAEAGIKSMGLDDPVLRGAGDWVSGPNKFASTTAPHHTALGGSPLLISPQQDTDSSGLVTNAGMHLPAPKGSSANPTGLVRSVGELGFIHTGMSTSGTGAGTPWRTVRLQPQKTGETTLPDWVLTDLFSVPLSVPSQGKDYVQPASGSVGGRINLNARLHPFEDGSSSAARLTPLAALLVNGQKGGGGLITSNDAKTLAGNIAEMVLASNGGNSGRAFGNTSFFYAPGQLAEIQGVADTGEQSEAAIRSAIGLATVRGNVFSIYGVGQSLKEDRNGRLHILAEKRQQKIFERSPNGALLPVFSRELTP